MGTKNGSGSTFLTLCHWARLVAANGLKKIESDSIFSTLQREGEGETRQTLLTERSRERVLIPSSFPENKPVPIFAIFDCCSGAAYGACRRDYHRRQRHGSRKNGRAGRGRGSGRPKSSGNRRDGQEDVGCLIIAHLVTPL